MDASCSGKFAEVAGRTKLFRYETTHRDCEPAVKVSAKSMKNIPKSLSFEIKKCQRKDSKIRK